MATIEDKIITYFDKAKETFLSKRNRELHSVSIFVKRDCCYLIEKLILAVYSSQQSANLAVLDISLFYGISTDEFVVEPIGFDTNNVDVYEHRFNVHDCGNQSIMSQGLHNTYIIDTEEEGNLHTRAIRIDGNEWRSFESLAANMLDNE